MKRPLINKLGTAMNTIGSLGVGYYIAKLSILNNIDFTNPNLEQVAGALQPASSFPLAVCLLILAGGLFLRIRDLVSRHQEEVMTEGALQMARGDVCELENRICDLQTLLEVTLDDVVGKRVTEELDRRFGEMQEGNTPTFELPDPDGGLKTDMEYQESRLPGRDF